MPHTIRWLHLSDFHVGKDDFGQSKVFQYILDDIKLRTAESPLDFVFITGDIAQAGLVEQYDLFINEFLEKLEALVGPDCQILIVPGNHDLDRTEAKYVSRDSIQKELNFFDASETGRKERRSILPRFQQYHEKILFPSPWLDTVEGCFIERKTINGVDVGILGINTAWLSEGADKDALNPGKSLVEAGLEKIADAHVRIVLGHHPVNWFSQTLQDPIQALFGKKNVIYLHGHLHTTRSSLQEGAGNPYLALQTGAAFQAREDDVWRNRILWAELNMAEHVLEMMPLCWNVDYQGWVPDGDAFPGQYYKNGYWSLPLPGEPVFLPPVASGSGNLPSKDEELVLHEQKVFYLPSFGKQEELRSTFRSFHFAAEEDDFIGREDILKQLDDTLLLWHKDAPQFQWAAICGDAGTGKSRLALHVLERHSTTWPVSGFVRKSFVTIELTLDTLSGITGPTLFVIDYAGSASKACCRFIEQCALSAEGAPFPVRIIVLLRRSNDRFFEYVREKEDGAIAFDTQVKFASQNEYNPESGALILTALREKETLDLMRIAHAAKTAEPEIASGPEKETSIEKLLLSHLRYFDERMRPLFALMVANTFQKGLIKDKPAKTTQEEARLTLFRHYLEHQFDKQWKCALGKSGELSEEDRIDRHINFLILSTMCRGLTNDGWQRLVEEPSLSPAAKVILPHSPLIFKENYGAASDLLDENLLMALSGSLQTNSDQDAYPILEPDLIGEALVLLVHDQREKNLCLQSGTVERRYKYLRDFAWTADPEGAAFFSVLVAQDYPEHAARLQWFLPDNPGSNITAMKVKLFRNLVLVTTEPFRYRAPIQDDVERIKKLIEKFRPKPSDPGEIQLEFLVGLVDLTDQLRFMVNKMIAPRGVDQNPVFPDKLGRRRLEFDRASNDQRSECPEETDAKQPDDEVVYQFHSDPKAIDAALLLLRQFYDESIEPVFSHNDLELRYQYAKIIRAALNSVFWTRRNNKSAFGFAASPPSEEEITERHRLADFCNSALSTPNLDEDTLAVVCDLVHSIIFAEHGAHESRGRKTFEAICDKALARGFTKEMSIQSALKFIGNHACNEINLEYQKEDPSERQDLGALGNTADMLMRLAIKLPNLTEQGRKSIASAFFDVCHRVARYDAQRHRITIENVDGRFTLFIAFIDRHGTVPVGDKAVNFFSAQFNAYRQLGEDATSVLTRYSDLVGRSHFDRLSLNKPSWKNFDYHLLQLAYLPCKSLATVQKLIQTLIEQIGARANRDLIEMLQYQLPNPKLMPGSVEALAELGCDCSEEIVGADKRSNLSLAILSQHLLCGDDNVGFMDLDERWTVGDNEEDFVARTEVFHHLQMLVWWHGLDHSKVKAWRQSLLNFLNAEDHVAEKNTSPIRRSHHLAAIAAANTFAQLEVAAGLSPDDWLLLKENIA